MMSPISSASTELGFHSPLRRIQSDRQRLDDLLRLASGGISELLAVQASVIDEGLLTYGR